MKIDSVLRPSAELRISLRALPVDVKEHVAPGIDRFGHGRHGRAVEMTKDMGMFQHRAIGHHGLEGGLGQEMVMLAIHLPRPGRARRGRDREAQ